MDFFDCLSSRRSVRSYKPDPVEEATLDRVLEAARLAPTACNYQPFRVFVLRTEGRAAELKRIYSKPWFASAPLLLHICSVPAEAWSRKDGKGYADVDATIAMDHLVLAASALGLGTCWVAAFDPLAAREVLGLEAGWEPLAFTPLGYPLDEPSPRPRKSLEQLVFRR